MHAVKVVPSAFNPPAPFMSSSGTVNSHSVGRRAFLTSSLTLAIGSPGCAYRSTPFNTYQPLLYRLKASQGHGQAYVFGAVHLGHHRFYPLPDAVQEAWVTSDCLAVELDIETRHQSLREAFSQRVLLPTGQTLDSLLSSAEIKQICLLMGFDQHDWQRLRQLQPWALSINLHSPVEAPAGTEAALGLDLYFLRQARAQKKRVAELEDPSDQIEAFAGGALKEQMEQLRRRVQQLARHERTTELVIDAWRRGDILALAELKRDSFGDEYQLASLHDRMSVRRDRKMASALAQLLHQGSQVFCTVGAFHLVGAKNMLEVLEEEHGLKSERIKT
jgi:uncharacterized protein